MIRVNSATCRYSYHSCVKILILHKRIRTRLAAVVVYGVHSLCVSLLKGFKISLCCGFLSLSAVFVIHNNIIVVICKLTVQNQKVYKWLNRFVCSLFSSDKRLMLKRNSSFTSIFNRLYICSIVCVMLYLLIRIACKRRLIRQNLGKCVYQRHHIKTLVFLLHLSKQNVKLVQLLVGRIIAKL